MTTSAAQLLSEFEALPAEEKQIFVRCILRRLPQIDSGEVTDADLYAAGDALAAMLEDEERHDPQAR